MSMDMMKVFTGNAHPQLARDICRCLGLPLGDMVVTRFSDGETRVLIDESVRGCDIFLVQPLCAPTNDHLMELLIMCDAFKRASASRIVCVVPYYGYARQDKKGGPREPISAKLVADLMTVAGAGRLLTVELHAAQIMGFFDFPVDQLSAGPLMADYLRKNGLWGETTVVVSPDVGGVEEASRFADRIRAGLVIIAKRRNEPNQSEVIEVIGEVQDKVCVFRDDMVDTAGTMVNGAREVLDRGARQVIACATHAVLSGNALQLIAESPMEQLVVTDTIPVPEESRCGKIEVLPVAPMLAEAMKRVHYNESVSTMFT